MVERLDTARQIHCRFAISPQRTAALNPWIKTKAPLFEQTRACAPNLPILDSSPHENACHNDDSKTVRGNERLRRCIIAAPVRAAMHSPRRAVETAVMHFHERTMPPIRSTQSKATHQEFPWQGRFYAIRVIFTSMVLVMLAAGDAVCRNQPGAHFWLLVSGAAYPHVGHLIFGRFEGRRRRGYAVLVIDGLFAGAVMAAIGLALAPSAVLVAINLFNWIVVGGPALAALGVAAVLAGIAFSGTPVISQMPSPCMASDVLAGIALLAYFSVVARFIHHHIGALRQRHTQFQAESDATSRARKLADRALIAVLPGSAAEILAEKGELPSETLDEATILLIEFARPRSEPPSIADLTDCFQLCDSIVSRHGFECVKTFGRRYLAMSRAHTGPDDAVAAAREVSNFLFDHRALPGSTTAERSIRAFVHCGTVIAGLVQPSRLNFDLLGEPMETIDAMTARASDLSPGSVVASAAAQRRMQNASDFTATAAESGTTLYLSRLIPLP